MQTTLSAYLQKAASLFPGLKSMADDDLLPNLGSKHGMKLASEFHISLGRTVPIRIRQVDTMVYMLRRKFEGQRGFWIEFGSWEAFVNDDRIRSFLSLEIVATGYAEIKRQVSLVDDVYKPHSYPTFTRTLNHTSLWLGHWVTSWMLFDCSSRTECNGALAGGKHLSLDFPSY